MTPDRWQQIEDLLDQVFDLDPDARATVLDAACADDPALRGEVEALLAAAAEAPLFLDQDAAAFAAPVITDLPEEPGTVTVEPGQRLGAYRLLHEIGHGGMSVVYLAERADGQFSQQVAFKLLRHVGGDRDTRVARFRAERQILASLAHPHVAKVFDGGVTEGGWPYLVMEYVDGVAFTDYCAQHRLTVAERLELFGAVCDAVQHAHQRFVVHRDLKPSNILVTEDGMVKLLDFGIAKLLDEDGDAPYTVPVTHSGMRLLTPQYAAPEQVRGDAITTATDVYALGLLLYELLTGQRPYRLDDKSASEIERIVCEVEPTRPSTLVARAAEDDAPPVAVERLRGDLDTIVLKALRKEPDQRYGSARELADDLRRFRAGLPVKARTPTAGYRLRKFVQRNRRAVAAVAVVAAVLVAVVSFYTVRLQQERDQAQVEAATAERVSAFLTDLFTVSDPFEEVQGDTLRALDLLERGAARVETELAGEPEVQAAMMAVLGTVYRQLGHYDRAEPLLEQALALRQARWGDDHPDVAKGFRALAQLRENQGDFAAADSLARQALAVDRQLLGRAHPAVSRDLNLLGIVRYEQGDFAAADSLLQAALAIQRALPAVDETDVLTSLTELARVAEMRDDYAVAESLNREVLGTYRHLYGDEHPMVAQSLQNVAYLLRRQGKYDEAEAFYRESLAMKRTLLGDDHPSVATTLNNLGVLLGIMGRYDEVEPLFQEALAIRRARYGDAHPLVASTLHNLAMLTMQTGEMEKAEAYQQEGLAIRRAVYGDRHPDVAGDVETLGHIAYQQGNYAAAERAYRDALTVLQATLGEDNSRTARAMNNLGAALVDQRRYAEAEPILRRAVALHRAQLGDDHPEVAPVLRNLGRLLGATGRFEEGEALLREALQIQTDRLPPGHPRIAQTRASLADLYDAWGRPDDAATYRAE